MINSKAGERDRWGWHAERINRRRNLEKRRGGARKGEGKEVTLS